MEIVVNDMDGCKSVPTSQVPPDEIDNLGLRPLLDRLHQDTVYAACPLHWMLKKLDTLVITTGVQISPPKKTGGKKKGGDLISKYRNSRIESKEMSMHSTYYGIHSI